VKGNYELLDSSMLLPEDLISLVEGRNEMFWPSGGGIFDYVFGDLSHQSYNEELLWVMRVKETEQTKYRKVSNIDNVAREHEMLQFKSSFVANTIANIINLIVLTALHDLIFLCHLQVHLKYQMV
jgi:hypothetical protein